MRQITLPRQNQRKVLFEDASEKLGIPYGMIEKDFWVCWVLSRIFGDQNLRGLLRFKGGTSLSKIFHLIKRFSEDIDLILNWRLVTQNDPMKDRSNAQQDKFNKRVQEESADYISTTLKGRIASVFDGECRVDADDDDGHIIWIEYPHDDSDGYILPRVKLEIGPLGLLDSAPGLSRHALRWRGVPATRHQAFRCPDYLGGAHLLGEGHDSASGTFPSRGPGCSVTILKALLRPLQDVIVGGLSQRPCRYGTPSQSRGFQAQVLSKSLGEIRLGDSR